MAQSLNVVALISGGKDSLFSILHCLENGHKVVALANLTPAAELENEEEMDSYMYQTVGSSVLRLYGEALGLPLFQQAIEGSAICRAETYERQAKVNDEAIRLSGPEVVGGVVDEVESMRELLKRVKRELPEINAVCSGAILSTYQRTRVESVAIELNLTSLSYLWQYPYLPPYRDSSLLEDMAAVGQDARIIKVASAALDQSNLWLNVADGANIRRLLRRMEPFSPGVGEILGEGGEFETLVIDGPPPLWKKRIEIRETDRANVVSSGGSFSLHCLKAQLASKDIPVGAVKYSGRVRVPEVLDDSFNQTLSDVQQKLVEESNLAKYVPSGVPSMPFQSAHLAAEVVRMQVYKELESCFSPVTGRRYADVAFTLILLRDMAAFQIFNDVYRQKFNYSNPPARVTIGCGNSLPEGVHVRMLPVMAPFGGYKNALHVQSRSYWAPANIGPYSQAVSVGMRRKAGFSGNVISPEAESTEDRAAAKEVSAARKIYLSGQIPLVPASMEVLEDNALPPNALFLKQTVLALQHLWRVGIAMKLCWWHEGAAFITATSALEAKERAIIVGKVWKTRHLISEQSTSSSLAEDEPSEDFEELALRRSWAKKSESPTAGHDMVTSEYYIEENDGSIGKTNLDSSMLSIPPFFVVQVDSLPRNAPVEWYGSGIATSKQVINIKFAKVKNISLAYSSLTILDAQMSHHSAVVVNSTQMLAFVDRALSWTEAEDSHASTVSYQIEIFIKPETMKEDEVARFLIQRNPNVIPCKRIFNSEGEEVMAGVRIHVNANT